MDPEINASSASPGAGAAKEKRSCEKCGSTNLSITPVPGLWLQYWCDSCDHWWWETRDGQPLRPDEGASSAG